MPGVDVLVLGAGPAGWAAAAACARAGLVTHLVAPAPYARWTQTYGAWLDELAAAGATAVAGHQWDVVRVRTTGPGFRTLPRTYCVIDNDRLREALTADASTVAVTTGRASHLVERGDHVVVTTGRDELHARVVIDATGHPAVFGARASAPLAHQTAYGVVARFSKPPIPAGTMCLMDFDATPFAGVDPPTFLYAMDLGDGRWFVEETSLAGRPAVGLRLLQRRLERRLADRRAVATEILATERCAFAMNAPLPRGGPVIAFGAAAAMVHPATGYHVAFALQHAAGLADTLRQALDLHRDARTIARAGHRAVWPTDALRLDALYRLGLEVVLALDTESTQKFFNGFFDLPADSWRGYVSRTSSPLTLQRTMARLMLRVPADVRRRVLQTVATPRSLRTIAGAVAPTILSR